MFRLVLLCALFAAAAAKPDILISTPYDGYSTFISPASTTITKQASSVIQPSPLVYSSPPLVYSHYIKKRSPQIPLGYFGPTSYVATNPLVGTAPVVSPLVHTTSILPAVSPLDFTTHLIKKRSAALLPTGYITPTTYAAATAPLYPTAYTAGSPFWNSPLLSQPIVYPSHLIKKRAVPVLTIPSVSTFPSSVSHQARIDLEHLVHSPAVYGAIAYPGVY